MQTSVPLMRQLLRASQERQAAAASAAADARARLLARLQLARRRQQAREEAALSHGTERWQQQQVVLHEADLARRDAAASTAASQERQVARLWMKLQRQLTHPRAPWAPAPSAEAEMEAVFKLDKSENALRQRCRLRRVEGGTRHPEASISQKLAEAGRQAADTESQGMCKKPAAWCVHEGATNDPSWCGGVPGHYCHDTYGQSGFSPCDKHIPATWGAGVQCLEASCACSSVCHRDAALRSRGGFCGQAVEEAGCTHERLYAPAQPGVGIVVLERNEVYRVNDIVYCSTKAPAIACTRARLDARTIMCEETSLTLALALPYP